MLAEFNFHENIPCGDEHKQIARGIGKNTAMPVVGLNGRQNGVIHNIHPTPKLSFHHELQRHEIGADSNWQMAYLELGSGGQNPWENIYIPADNLNKTISCEHSACKNH